MLPLAPLDPHKTRALTTIYAPRKLRTRKHRTAQTRMLDNDLPVKPSLSPFHPLPAIGQKLERSNTKVIVFDLKKDTIRPCTMETPASVKIRDVLKPLTPLRVHALRRSSQVVEEKKPFQLLRENTYDVIEPIYLNAVKVKKRDSSVTRIPNDKEKQEDPKVSPKTRFKKAALQVAKLTAPETGKLLCLRERQTFALSKDSEDDKSTCRLQELPQSPAHKLNHLSEIFQSLEMKGRHKDRMKKENSWF